MNSSGDFPLNGILQEGSSSGSQIATSDSNANLSNANQNKGAIPKTKPAKPASAPKKPAKLNNNVEDIVIPQSPTNLTDSVLQMHADVLRLNGFSDQLSRISSSYLDDYKTVLYGNGDDCENCGANKASGMHDSRFNSDLLTNSSCKDENATNESPCKVVSSASCSKDLCSGINLQLKLDSDSCSSEDNELLSISDDGCIYTYKGDHVADLPSSFFSLDIPPPRSPEVLPQDRQETASPEMDFLEMDFDPGPSGDADSDSQSNADLENTENLPQDPTFKHVDLKDSKVYLDKKTQPSDSATACSAAQINSDTEHPGSNLLSNKISDPPTIPRASTSGLNLSSNCVNTKQDSPISCITEKIRKMRMPWAVPFNYRTVSKTNTQSVKRHSTNGELTSPGDRMSTLCDMCTHGIDGRERYRVHLCSSPMIQKSMIWSEEEASRKQITQIGASACGATAVLNVLNALRFPVPPLEVIKEAVRTRLRANSSPLAEYLLSRSVAGSTHEDLIEGLEKLTDGQVYARFFHMYPERFLNLSMWLQFWMSHGAVAIATLNLQKCSGTIPDAWHHQMIFGVGPLGVYLTNPLECVHPGELWPQLSSESVLLVRKEDVLSRWNIKGDLEQLMKIKDRRWRRMNVVGQVANLVRENARETRFGFANTSHIKIPAAYSSGITLVVHVDSPLRPFLMYCPELPLLSPKDEAAGYADGFC